jgi:hypothetical protein
LYIDSLASGETLHLGSQHFKATYHISAKVAKMTAIHPSRQAFVEDPEQEVSATQRLQLPHSVLLSFLIHHFSREMLMLMFVLF